MIYAVVVAAAWLIWNLVFRIKVVGRENLPTQGAFVLVPNHISAIDPVFVVIARFWGKRMVVMAKEELFKNAFLKWIFTQFGAVAVARGKGDTQMLDHVIEGCREGRGVLIFAEGTRSKNEGWPGKLKSGAFVVAAEAGAPIVPCRIIYCTKDREMHLFCRVKVCFGAPISAPHLGEEGKPSSAKLRETKHLVEDAWRQLYQENKLDWMPDQPLPQRREIRTRNGEEKLHEDTAG